MDNNEILLKSDDFHYTFKNLKPGEYHQFSVCAKNQEGWSEWSDILGPICATISIPNVPPPPSLIKPTSISLVARIFPPDNDNGSKIIKYHFELYYADKDSRVFSITIDPNTLELMENSYYEYFINDLRSDQEYNARIAAENSLGISNYSSFSLITSTLAPTEPVCPPFVNVVALTSEYISIEWGIPFDGGAAILGYKITERINEMGNFDNMIEVGNKTQHTFYDVKEGNTYEFCVYAYNCVGDSESGTRTDLINVPMTIEHIMSNY